MSKWSSFCVYTLLNSAWALTTGYERLPASTYRLHCVTQITVGYVLVGVALAQRRYRSPTQNAPRLGRRLHKREPDRYPVYGVFASRFGVSGSGIRLPAGTA